MISKNLILWLNCSVLATISVAQQLNFGISIGQSDTPYPKQLQANTHFIGKSQRGSAPLITLGYESPIPFLGASLGVMYVNKPHFNAAGQSTLIKNNIVYTSADITIPTLSPIDLIAHWGLSYTARSRLQSGQQLIFKDSTIGRPIIGASLQLAITSRWRFHLDWLQCPSKKRVMLPRTRYIGLGASVRIL